MKKLTINTALSLQDVFDEFQTYNKAKNLSNETIKTYYYAFRVFSEYYDVDSSCENINQDTIYDYINFLQNKNISSVSVTSYIRNLRAILYYAMKREYIKNFKIELPRAEKQIKKTYTEEELRILLEKPNIKQCTFAHYRNWVLVNFLFRNGFKSKNSS